MKKVNQQKMRISPLHLDNYLSKIDVDHRVLYKLLKHSIDWVKPENSIAKRRLSFNFPLLKITNPDLYESLEPEIMEIIRKSVETIANHYKYEGSLDVVGIFLNYQRDGNDYTPSHTHKDTAQFVIGLSQKRKLFVNKKYYSSGEGSLSFFGSSPHGVEQEKDIKKGRISIAVFLDLRNVEIKK